MNPEALNIIANQRLAEMHHEAEAARLSRQAARLSTRSPQRRRPLRRLLRLARPEPRPQPATSAGRC